MEINLIESILLFVSIYLLITTVQLRNKTKGLEYKLEQVSKLLNATELPINEELKQLIQEGHDVQAVKKARETLGLSLVEGKQYIDSLKSQQHNV
ncbi:hypothetical protein GCM10008935_13990 [Alkalibacillus silvisoli]|uniref:Ribosomal protein L7/L12 C-terminal domain-containing protein n=2 Tax=Alkalibacillus silvisoli TaxID=392823 RepID=A0ABN0ZUZ1_9BACI